MSGTHPRIDAHHHFLDPTRADYPWLAGEPLAPIRRWFGPDDLVPELAAQGISGTVLVQTLSSLDETRGLPGSRDTAGLHLGRCRVGRPDLAGGRRRSRCADRRSGRRPPRRRAAPRHVRGRSGLVASSGRATWAHGRRGSRVEVRPPRSRAGATSGCGHRCGPAEPPVRPRPHRQAANRRWAGCGVAGVDARAGRAPECRREALRPGHGGGLGVVDAAPTCDRSSGQPGTGSASSGSCSARIGRYACSPRPTRAWSTASRQALGELSDDDRGSSLRRERRARLRSPSGGLVRA